MLLLDSENADRNLTSLVTVLTHTPDASNARLCIAYVAFGDGTKNLNGSGGDFELTVQVGSQVIQPSPQVITFGTVTRAGAFTFAFPVPANTAVLVKALSPNGADTDVDVTAYLYDASSDILLADAEDVYHANIEVTVDEANTQDEYTVILFKNGVRITSGVTSPTLTVSKRADGTALINAQTITEIGTTEAFKYDATTTSRLTAGEAALAIVSWTSDGASHSFATVVTRDSE